MHQKQILSRATGMQKRILGVTTRTGAVVQSSIAEVMDLENYFNSIKTLCNETKLRDFYYKLLHRIVTTKRELFFMALPVIKHATFVVCLTLLNTPSLIALSQITIQQNHHMVQ